MSLSLSPGGILARLDELKKWQQVQQERFAKQMPTSAPIDLDLISPIPRRGSSLNSEIEGITPLSDSDEGKTLHFKSKEAPQQIFRNLTDDTPTIAKKPFLRKGAGLAKFRMTLEDTKPSSKPPPCILKSKSIKQAAEAKKSLAIKKHLPPKSFRPKSPQLSSQCQESQQKNFMLKSNVAAFSQIMTNERPLSPNKRSDYKETVTEVTAVETEDVPKLENPRLNFSYKPKGLWTNVSQMQKSRDLTPVSEEESIISQINRIVNERAESGANVIDREVRTRRNEIPPSPRFNINELGEDTFLAEVEKFFKQQQNALCQTSKADEFETPINVFKKPFPLKNQPVIPAAEAPPPEINQSERELRVFEALEQKASHSSFCSTNSSVAHLLSMQSTPQKVQPNKNRTASPNSTVTSDDVKDENEMNFEDENHWSSSESESDSEDTAKVHNRVLIVVDAETMTDAVEGTFNDDVARKLHSLESEIQVFRSENSRLARAKIDMEKEMRDLRKQKKEMEEEKVQMEHYLEEEKRKLAKDKMVFEKYVKDLKNKPSKKEREEISMLRSDLAAAKEELKLKESRHGAAQARLRTQIKQLEKDKDTLLAEMESLRTQNGRLMAQQKLVRPMTDTKVIHEINKKLTKLTQDKTISEKRSDSGRGSNGNSSNRTVKVNIPFAASKSVSNCSAFSNGTTRFEDDTEEVEDDSEDEEVDETDFNDMNNHFGDRGIQTKRIEKPLESLPVVYARQISHPLIHSASAEKILDVEKISAYDFVNGTVSKQPNVVQENNRNVLNFSESCSSLKTNDTVERDYESMVRRLSEQESPHHDYSLEENHKRERQERYLKDGSQEILYPNGNLKTISPDGNLIKMVYYNGDVKETDLSSGTIDYLYAESGIRHLTYSDGIEVLNFPDGKVEKRYKDGSFEFITSDGFIRNVDAEGREEITYPDGTRVSVSVNGEKIVKLPNGQRIVHTKEHKRREYPDGTVNILYPDGLLETRYKNGRIRLKDSSGRCLMDSHAKDVE